MNQYGSKTHGGILIVAFMLTMFMVGVAVVSLARLDVTTVTPCLAEDGPGVTGSVPCVWTSTTTGPYVGYRWVLYAERCPVDTVQSGQDVRCIGRDDWSGQ